MRAKPLLAAVVACTCLHAPSPAFPQAALPDQDSAEALVLALYDAVTFPAGTAPDWDRVRAMFLDRATVVLRTSRTATSVFDVEGFVQDFVAFIARANVRETGFSERVVRTKAMTFGDIAHVLVLYEASIPGSGRPPQQGVDSFQLVRREGRWWIVSITNELPGPDRPLPPELREPTSAG
jgi:hypothetical protein